MNALSWKEFLELLPPKEEAPVLPAEIDCIYRGSVYKEGTNREIAVCSLFKTLTGVSRACAKVICQRCAAAGPPDPATNQALRRHLALASYAVSVPAEVDDVAPKPTLDVVRKCANTVKTLVGEEAAVSFLDTTVWAKSITEDQAIDLIVESDLAEVALRVK